MSITKNDFMEIFLDLLQRDDPLTAETTLTDLAEWDSMSIMAVMAYADKKHGKTLMLDDFKSLTTVDDLYELICQRKTI